MVRMPPFHGGNTGSNPVGVTKFIQIRLANLVLVELRRTVVHPRQITLMFPLVPFSSFY
jgi:hypothetical protein